MCPISWVATVCRSNSLLVPPLVEKFVIAIELHIGVNNANLVGAGPRGGSCGATIGSSRPAGCKRIDGPHRSLGNNARRQRLREPHGVHAIGGIVSRLGAV